jgi:hypothetical protein
MITTSPYCCATMSDEIVRRCSEHVTPFDCPDTLILYEPRFDEYGLIIHDGGRFFCLIAYCPWCGAALPASKRDRWFDELAALGFDDPVAQPIPIAFTTDAWYRPTTEHLPTFSAPA